VWQVVREWHAALAVLLECARTGKDTRRAADEPIIEVVQHVPGHGLAMMFFHYRLGIQEVELRGPAGHEEENDILCPRRKMRLQTGVIGHQLP